MIVDCHTHVNHYEDESVEALPGCLEKLQLTMRRNRVDAALILTSYKVPIVRITWVFPKHNGPYPTLAE